MKKLVTSIALFLCAIFGYTQSTPTPYIGLKIPAARSTNWNVPLQYNFGQIDAYLGGAQPVPSFKINSTLTVLGSASIGTSFTVPTATITTLNLGNPLSVANGGTGNIFGEAPTAANLQQYPSLCGNGQFSQGLSTGSNNCATPAGSGGTTTNALTLTNALATPTSQTFNGSAAITQHVIDPSQTGTQTMSGGLTVDGILSVAYGSYTVSLSPLGTMTANWNFDTKSPVNALNSLNLPSLVQVACPVGDTIAQCVAMLPSTGGTVILGANSYTSGASATCLSGSNINIVGTQQPVVNSGGTALVGGSIIEGGVWFCGTNHSMSNLGVDVGSDFVTGGGTCSDGIVGSPATYTSGTAALAGDTLNNVTVLGPDCVNHAFRTEHETGVNWTNVTNVNSQQHGFTIKSSNAVLNGFTSLNSVTDSVIVTSDGNTPAVDAVAISSGVINTSSGADGITVGTEGISTTSNVSVSNLQITIGGANTEPCLFINNDNGGNGAVNHLTYSDISCTVSGGGHSGFFAANPSSYTEDTVSISNFQFYNPTTASGVVAFNDLTSAMTNLSINNLYSYCQTYESQVEGTAIIDGWSDMCPTSLAGESILSSDAATTITLSGFTGNRGSDPYNAFGGSVITMAPSASTFSQDNSGQIVKSDALANSYDKFSSTAGAEYLQTISTISYGGFESLTSAATWEEGQIEGNGHYSIGKYTSPTFFNIFDLDPGAPEGSVAILASGQPSFGYFNTGSAGCVQSTGTGLLSNTGTPCGSGTIASGSLALATSAISSASCQAVTAGSVNSAVATGVVTTDVISYTPNASLSAVTGYAPSTSGGLRIIAYATAGYVNFDVCNESGSSITPGAVTLNWRVSR